MIAIPFLIGDIIQHLYWFKHFI